MWQTERSSLGKACVNSDLSGEWPVKDMAGKMEVSGRRDGEGSGGNEDSRKFLFSQRARAVQERVRLAYGRVANEDRSVVPSPSVLCALPEDSLKGARERAAGWF